MAWTYDPTLATDKDKVRLLVGDTQTDAQQLSDEELLAMLTIYGGVKSTAIAVLRVLASKYARLADKWVGDLKILASQKHEAYLRMAEALSSSGALTVGIPTAGGILVADKEATRDNDALVTPTFRRGLTDNEEEG